MNLTVARDAIRQEIDRLAADQARLQAVLKQLDQENDVPTEKRARPAKRRLRLKDDVAADLSAKIVKAVRAHRSGGASRGDILTYLSRNGYEVGHHFNEPHLSKMVSTLVAAEAPVIRKEGERANTRYFVAGQ